MELFIAQGGWKQGKKKGGTRTNGANIDHFGVVGLNWFTCLTNVSAILSNISVSKLSVSTRININVSMKSKSLK